ncbi:MAG TPA: multidrug efflux RND transporter permease subunit [Oxalicibacterium sp.]|uniref:multidrug efflux RND transporter permease subunit n=1 Tax=Oxalicibacterium sp. TaxID=2766525 RepID=UPI002D0CDE77|nr:multidrug efflux RND transporter permease subunit [Oxalicibacterium sp.]HWU98138.1 multidrug efflux RND transporter permease subunit [Oxalicibacterium sp.]
MSLSTPFIHRGVATTLLTLGIALAGIVSFGLLPVSPLPQVDFPTISVSASLPGASPETMASTVATPLERSLGRIAGITEMTSSSSLGSARITLQFDLNRDIDGAARDVQAAINAARVDLPSTLRSNPTYRKVNPADAPIMIIALTSDTMTQGQMYDAASTILQQKLSQVQGIGQVSVGGSSLPAVRVELNPMALNKYGIGLDQVRTALQSTNANRPKGFVESTDRQWQIATDDQAKTADQYRPLIVAYKNGAPVQLSSVAEVTDSVEDLRNAGMANGKRSVLLIMNRQPNANIIETVDRVRALLPNLKASIPAAINMDVVLDQTTTIRASLHDVEFTLLVSIALVIMVVFLFLRNVRASIIPSVAVPISLLGTFGIMYLLGFSLNNFSLMALTISTGFVVDDAIVVLENVMRHIEKGMKPLQAALLGAREVGFTVLSMSISLVAVFIPMLLMGGLVGRYFHEFAITLSVAVLVSLVVSLSTTPMMCARILRRETEEQKKNRWYVASERVFEWMVRHYERSLNWALRHTRIMMLIMFAVIGFNVYLYGVVPKGFFPQQDTGRIAGMIQADQATSFQAMQPKLAAFIEIVRADPAVASVIGFTGGSQRNTGQMFIALKPLAERKISADEVINRLRGKLARVPGATLYLQATQDIRVGGRSSNSQYQYTLQGDDLNELTAWGPRVVEALRTVPQLVDVNTTQQDKGLQITLTIDRDTATRLGVTQAAIDSTLYDAFGQRQASVIYAQRNQYHVIMEVAPQYWQRPETLKDIYVRSNDGVMVPLSSFSRFEPTTTTLSVSHQGQFAATTISFNLAPGVVLSDATQAINDKVATLNMPNTVHGSFQGTAKVFQSSFASLPFLILASLATIYIVLGMLYESYVHPITILSTLPSAGVGAILALLLFHMDLSIMGFIGIILLIGIVKKNAIMMIDFALVAQRTENRSPRDAIHQACLLRFRPIMMTTAAALLGALPLMLGTGTGSELRRPLGVTIVGGLIVSQMLTLYTTPVVYLYMDRFSTWSHRTWSRWRGRPAHAADAVS